MLDRLPSSLARRAGLQPAASPAGLSRTTSTATTAVSTISGWENGVWEPSENWGQIWSKTDQMWSEIIDLDGLGRFLREEHPRDAAKSVAKRTRQPFGTVKKWLNGSARPNLHAALVLVCVYGPEVLAAMLREPPEWLDASARAAEQARQRSRLSRAQTRRGAR